MERKKINQELKASACELLRRLEENDSGLVVRYEGEAKPEATVPAELERYIVSCLRSICTPGQTGKAEGRGYTVRRYVVGDQNVEVFFYENGIVNVYLGGNLLAGADMLKPAGELEAIAQAMLATRLLNSLRIFV